MNSNSNRLTHHRKCIYFECDIWWCGFRSVVLFFCLHICCDDNECEWDSSSDIENGRRMRKKKIVANNRVKSVFTLCLAREQPPHRKNNAGTVVYPSLVWRFFIISKSVSRITSYTQTHIISFQVNSCSHKTECVLWIKNGLRSPLSCLKCVWSHEINVIERQIFVKNHGWRKFDVLLWNFAIFTWFLPQKRTKFFNRGICKQHYLLSIRLI